MPTHSNPNTSPNAITCTCLWCGATFRRWPANVAKGLGRYCSHHCRAKGRLGFKGTPSERFWARVDKSGPLPAHRPELGACWLWLGSRSKDGYGHFRVNRSTLLLAHRFSFTEHGETIQDNALICHRCDNPTCVRPSHLFSGSHLDNSVDAVRKGRKGKRLTIAQVLEVRSRYAQGETNKTALARDYGVDSTTVYEVVTRRTWRHI